MMFFVHAPNDLGLIVGGGVRNFLPSQGYDERGVIPANERGHIGAFSRSGFVARPFGPQIDAGRGLHQIGYMRTADAGGGFKEVYFAILVGNDEFGVADPASKTHGGKNILVEGEQTRFNVRTALDHAGGENTSAV